MASDDKQVPFLPPEPESTFSARSWVLAVLAVLLLLGVAAIATIRHSPTNTGEVRAADGYAGSLPIGDVSLSEAINGTGGKATYVDGSVGNTGAKTLTAALVQVTFYMADGSSPHREVLPLALVRTRVPYVDLQPVAAEPMRPGDRRDFRLIFEAVPANWDVKPPSIQVVHTEFK